MDYKECLEKVEKAIQQLKDLNVKVPIIVEGEKDVEALRLLGMTGTVIPLHTGKELANFCDDVAAKYKEIILLTDWDRKGWNLTKAIERNLSGRTKCITDIRLIFAKNMGVKNTEGIPSYLKKMITRLDRNKRE
jgi:5S rRNA maturation endonuclease (ribonuclease M5)